MAFFSSKKSVDKKTSTSQVEDKKIYLLPTNLTIRSFIVGKLHEVSKLPIRMDRKEWLATNCLQFFNHINSQYEVMSEFCSCSSMCVGTNVYEWQDGKSSKKQKLSARQYVDTGMAFIQRNMEDENTFPTKFGSEFPSEFEPSVKKVFRIYFVILGHIYLHHYEVVLRLRISDWLNTLFLHFSYFVQEFSLLEHKELSVLEDLMIKLIQKDNELVQQQRSEEGLS